MAPPEEVTQSDGSDVDLVPVSESDSDSDDSYVDPPSEFDDHTLDTSYDDATVSESAAVELPPVHHYEVWEMREARDLLMNMNYSTKVCELVE